MHQDGIDQMAASARLLLTELDGGAQVQVIALLQPETVPAFSCEETNKVRVLKCIITKRSQDGQK